MAYISASTTSCIISILYSKLNYVSAIVDMYYSEMLLSSVTRLSLNTVPGGFEIPSDESRALSFTADIKSYHLSHIPDSQISITLQLSHFLVDDDI